MLASITPLGERGRNNRFALTASAYALGATLGGLSLGALAGAAGWAVAPSSTQAAVLVAGVAVAAVVVDLAVVTRWRGVAIPTIHRQVNEDWLTRYRGWVYGLGFGFQLGLGVVTIVTTVAVYAAVADAVLTGSLLGGVLIGTTFGLVRGLVVFAGARVQRPDQLTRVHRDFARRAPTAARLTILVEALVVCAAATVVLGAS